MTTPRLLTAVALLYVLLTSACNHPALLLDANADNLHTARNVAAAFYAQYGKELNLKDEPFVTIGVEGGQGYSYDIAHNVLFVTPFSQADFDTQKIFAKACAEDRAATVYDELMFGFFTAHQLMHLVYDELPLTHVDEYEEELRINTLTWLFLERNKLLPGITEEHLAAYQALSAQLERRFPSLQRGDNAATLPVEDNASYWYVTAASLQASYAAAAQVGSPTAYVAALETRTVSVDAATH